MSNTFFSFGTKHSDVYSLLEALVILSPNHLAEVRALILWTKLVGTRLFYFLHPLLRLFFPFDLVGHPVPPLMDDGQNMDLGPGNFVENAIGI